MKTVKHFTLTILCLLLIVSGIVFLTSCGGIENFNLSFKVDGNVYQAMTTTGTEIISIPENPKKEGYTFDGWYWDEGTWEKPFTANSLLNAPISSDMSVYAKFKPTNFGITYEADGAEHENPLSYSILDEITLSPAQKSGYAFIGWYLDDEYIDEIKSIEVGSIGSLTLYAQFEMENYTISYKDTKDQENTNPTKYNIKSDTISLTPLSKDGYIFEGWYNGSEKVSSIEKGSVGNVTLTAKWSAIDYEITYNNVDGAEHDNVSTYNADTALTFSYASKVGYNFLGWYDASDNKVEKIASGTIGNLDLYAKWEAIEYTATFMDGDTVAYKIIFTVETESIENPAVPEHLGYTGVWESYTLSTENIIINAIYTPIGYEITYHNVEGAKHDNMPTYDVEDEPLALLNASKDYYNFIGWYTDSEFTNKISEIAVGTVGDLDLYAKWEAIEYTATFKDGDTVVAEIKFTIETEEIENPEVPEHPGYTGAWEEYTLSLSNITVNAVYEIIGYEITYHNVDSAQHNNPNGYNVELEPLALSDAEKTGYNFAGWYTDSEFTNKISEIAVGTVGDLDLYAKWEAIEYTATFKDGDTVVAEIKFTIETEEIENPEVPEHPGYTGAWEEYTLSLSDITVNAVYTSIVYTITYEDTKDAQNSNPTTYTIESGAISLANLSKTGYTFDGWYYNGNPVDVINEGSCGDITLTAKWTPIVYTITYDGTKNAENPNPTTYTVESETIVLSKLSTTGYTFVSFTKDGKEITEIPQGSTGDITLTATWKLFALGEIEYDNTKLAVSVNDEITAELFGATCIDTNGDNAVFTVSVSGNQVAGGTISVRLVAKSQNKTKQVTISGVRVYDAPTLEFDNTVDYVNLVGGITGNHFSASGKDSFGNATEIKVYIDGEYKAGDIVKVTIESIDPSGNITKGYVENVKAYGLPQIIYNEQKTAISVNDTINANLFGATAKDSFGNDLSVTATLTNGTVSEGNTVSIRLSATDSKGNVKNIDISCQVYGAPTISDATNTDIKVDDEITPSLLGITAKDTYNEALDVVLSVKSGTQASGATLVITATATDSAGNVEVKDFNVNVYGAPTLSYDKITAIKVSENPITDSSILNAVAKDSFGKEISVNITLASGKLTGGKRVTYTLSTCDHLGNAYSVTTDEIGVYDISDIKDSFVYYYTDVAKLYTDGSEFNAQAKDSFGNNCVITIEASDGSVLTAGQTTSIVLVATDNAGNRVVSSPMGNVRVFDMPTIVIDDALYESTDIEFMAVVYDSFGNEIYAEITYVGEQTVGETVVVTVKATDDADNEVIETFEYMVLGDGYVYTLKADDTYELTSYNGSSNKVAVLDFYNKKPVTSIAKDAFVNKSTITTLVIGKNVTILQDGILSGFSALESLTIPFVGGSADATSASSSTLFGYIFGSSNYTGGVSTTQYYSSSSYSTYCIPSSLKNVTVTGGNILYGAFRSCSSLTSVTIGNSITSIGNYAFYGCAGLTSIEIPDSVTSIGSCAFYNCTALTEINFNAIAMDDLSSSNYVFYNAGQNGEGIKVTIGKEVTKIPAYLFYPYYNQPSYSPKITSVTFEEGSVCESIGSYAFRGGTGLTSITIPDSVTSIGDYAFEYCTNLISVTIGNSVTSIGNYAFRNCTALEEINFNAKAMDDLSSSNYVFYNAGINGDGITVTIGKEVTKIPAYLFYPYSSSSSYSPKITSLVFEEGSACESIGNYAFYYCTSLTSVTIGDSVTSIGNDAFYGCTSLTSVNINDVASWCNIEFRSYIANPLYYAKNLYINGELLTELVIPNTITKINEYAFYGCTGLRSVTIPDSVISIGNYAFEGCESLTSITIPNSVTSIGSYAFYNCSNLTSVTIGDGVTSIGDYAFRNCTKLTSITIGEGVKSIGSYAFSDCNRLTSVTVNKNNATYMSIDGNLYTKDGKTLVLYATGKQGTFVIPDGVTSIGDYAFNSCAGLTSVTIPDGVTSIGDYAFNNCSRLTSVTIGDNVISIGNYAFYNCTRLTSITIPDSVTSIGRSAFFSCTRLTSITIPDSVTSIGSSAFYNCSSLKTLSIGKGVTSLPGGLLSGCSSLESLTIPFVGGSATATSASSSTLFGYIFGTSSYSGGVSTTQYYSSSSSSTYYIPSSLKNITVTGGNILYGAFYKCSNLTSITIGDSVTSIGDEAFITCIGLTNIGIPDSVTSIGRSAFYNCTSLTSITIPDSVTSIGNKAFSRCTKLTNITVNKNNATYMSIDGNLYTKDGKTLVIYAAGKQGTFVIPNSVTSIGDYAFEYCTNLTSITIPDSVTSIGNYAFYNCDSLTNVTIGDSVTGIGNYAFYDCNSLTNVTIGDSVTRIASYAFSYCSKLTSIIIGEGVKSIGSYAFYHCNSLTSVTLPDGVISIESYAFSYCSNLTSITIPDSVTSIGAYAFELCKGLKTIYYTGSNSQWNSIYKGNYWDILIGSYTITFNYTGK